MATPRRHLALVCFLHQAWRDTTRSTGPSTCTASSSTASWSKPASTACSRRQRQAVDRIVHRYHRLGAVLLDPDVGDDELRARLLSTVPEAQLREDQSDLANWTRGDRKARYEQTAERDAGLSRFAGPFLSRMKFVDEQGEDARRRRCRRCGPTANTGRPGAAASRPMRRSTSPRRRCSRSSAMTA